MALQTAKLTLFGIPIVGNTPPHALQPPLDDGMHLRWAFDPSLGFPRWFYLFRRYAHVDDKQSDDVSLADAIQDDNLTSSSNLEQTVGLFYGLYGVVSSDVALRMRARPSAPTRYGFDLRARTSLSLSLTGSVCELLLNLEFLSAGAVTITAFCDGVPIAAQTLAASAAGVMSHKFNLDKITSVTLSSGPALLYDGDYFSVTTRMAEVDNPRDWEKLPSVGSPAYAFPYPMTLPVSHFFNPLPGVGQAESYAVSRATALGRVQYDKAKYANLPSVLLTSTGTVAVTQGSAIVIGTGTNWTSALVGETFIPSGQPTAYTVVQVLDATRLVLNRGYQSAAATGVAYQIVADEFGPLYGGLINLLDWGVPPNPGGLAWANVSTPQPITGLGTVTVTQGSDVLRGSSSVGWTNRLVGLAVQVARPLAGTATTQQGSTEVIGIGTSWDESLEGALIQFQGSGGYFVIEKVLSPTQLIVERPMLRPTTTGNYTVFESASYRITAFISATQLRLDRPYEGASGSNRSYRIFPIMGSETGSEMVVVSRQYPLEFALLASLDPSIAQMLGLAWVDKSALPPANPNDFYDYCIVADYTGVTAGNADTALALVRNNDYSQIEVAAIFNRRLTAPAGLAGPPAVRAYLLPGTTAGSPNNVGLRWNLPFADDGHLAPDAPVLYHVWRAELGSPQSATAPPAPLPSALQPITQGQPVLVPDMVRNSGALPPSPPDWPSLRLYVFDMDRPEGWVSYAVSAVDIFGRHSARVTARWRQWTWNPPPELGLSPPWYFVAPYIDSVLHNYAVRVLDKTAPPVPIGVEAFLLDPADPDVLKDAAYNTFRNANPTAIGLRLRWRWTQRHHEQAPDTQEFRGYYQFGATPPAPDPRSAPAWQHRIVAVPYASFRDETVVDGIWVRTYEVFANLGSLIPLQLPSAAAPIVWAHAGVSAADGKLHTIDPRTTGVPAALLNRPGNEGAVGGPAKVFQIRRANDAVVSSPDTLDKVFASPADFHNVSRYTYRWTVPTLAAGERRSLHVYRALDESLFQVDWAQRPRPNMTESQLDLFPPEWRTAAFQAKRIAIAQRLNALNAFPKTPAGLVSALAVYRGLAVDANDALRVLAWLPGNEQAFMQITTQPLDTAAGAYEDKLDGRATNHYLYRSRYFDGANNPGALSSASPVVFLPDTAAPRAPVMIGATAGNQFITVAWASNREPDLAQYWLYRTAVAADAEDIRTMTWLDSRDVPAGPPSARPAQEIWPDAVVGGVVYYYRAVAVDAAGNVSDPSSVVRAQAYDYAPPAAPTWGPATRSAAGVTLSWMTPVPLRTLVERRDAAGGWRTVSPWLESATAYTDATAVSGVTYWYRLRTQSAAGVLGVAFTELEVA